MIKIRFLDIDIGNNRYRHKCGYDPATYLISSLGSSLIGGVASVFGQESANEANMNMNLRQMKFQHDENELNRNWQREENETNRRFEAEQADIARSEQNRFWHDQFDTESSEWYRQQDRIMQQWYEQQAYNSPEQQVIRARAAGFNPSAVSNQGGLQDSSVTMQSPSVPSVSAPSSVMPSGSSSSPALSGSSSFQPVHNAFSGVADMLRSVGSFVGDLSKADVDQTFKNDSLNLIRENWKSLTLKNRVDAVAAFVAENTKDVQVNKFMQEYENTIMMYDILGVEFDEKQQNILNLKEERLLKRAQRFMSEEQLNQLKELLPYVRKDMIQTIATKKSQESSNYASAFEARARGKTENDLRELRKKSIELSNDIAYEIKNGKHRQNVFESAVMQDKIAIVAREAYRAQLINELEYEEIRRAITENDFKVVDKFVNYIDVGFGSYRNFGIGRSALGGKSSSFDPDAGKAFIFDEDTGLLFKNPWSK